MPYIKREDRERLEKLVNAMRPSEIKCAGDLNYVITQLVHSYLGPLMSYQKYNDAIGALEGAKLELYRRHVSRYEDLKIEVNGDVP